MVLAASLSLLTVPDASADTTSGVAVVAHRGASASAPDNTLSSMAQAIASRADFVETDIRLTKDGVPVLMHDASLARTTDVESVFPGRAPWRVSDYTLAQVRRLDAGSWASATYTGERVPTLAALLRQLAPSPTGAVLEVKDPALYGGVDGIGAKVYDTIRALWPAALSAGSGRLVVSSKDAGFLQDFKARYPEVRVGVIATRPPSGAVTSFADDVDLRQDAVSRDVAAALHATGTTLGAWTVNDPSAMARLADQVDSITTDDPALLRSVLATRQQLFTGTSWPARASSAPTWSLSTSGGHVNGRVTLSARLTAADGSPARWQWAALQRLAKGSWRTMLRRATDASGRFSASVRARRGMRVRLVSLDDWQYPVAVSAAVDVPVPRVASSLSLSAPRSLLSRGSATLAIRWRSADGRPISGRAKLYRRPASGGSWTYVRDLAVSGGIRYTRVRPGKATRFKVRGRPGSWYTGATAARLVAS